MIVSFNLPCQNKRWAAGQKGEGMRIDRFEDVYDHAGRTRSAIRGFIKYLLAYNQGQRKKGNPGP